MACIAGHQNDTDQVLRGRGGPHGPSCPARSHRVVDDLSGQQIGAAEHAVYQGTTRGRALCITFDRPEKHPQDLSELRDVIADPASGAQATLITGAGQATFSAGTNIEAFAGLTPSPRHPKRRCVSSGLCRPSSCPGMASRGRAWSGCRGWSCEWVIPRMIPILTSLA